MRSLIPTNRRNGACEVCGNESGKCRRHSNNEIHLCMSYADARFGDIENGFKCIKPDKGKGWATFKLDNSQEWSQEQRREWKLRNEQRQQQQAKEDEQRRLRSLAAEERDQQYRQLLSQLTLHPDDRADLVRRGFTHKQIELAGFRSVESYQKLQPQFSKLLPGVGATGKDLINKHSGYLCPVRNADGLIVACQVRLRALPTGDKNRYRWLSGGEGTLHLYSGGCEVEGELPLAIFRPQGKPQGIALAEGTGAKPFLTSERLNVIAIGAAGGQFASSPIAFKATLNKLCEEIGKIKPIIAYPDAGDIANSSVMARWKRAADLVREWGFSLRFAWWGQATKQDSDIDELSDFTSIQYLEPDEFWALSQTLLPKTERSNREEKTRAEWRAKRTFTADIKRATQWCEWERPPENSLFFGKAGLGRGKTTRLRNWVKKWKEEGVAGFICLGYRNTLLLQLCASDEGEKRKKGLGFYHLHEHSGILFKSASNEGIALCVDSLWRFSPEDFDGKIIIIDEVMSVVRHLLQSPTVKNRDRILSLFAEAIKRARQVVCLDGLMADWCVDYIKSISPDKKIIKAENTYQGKKPLINFLLGTSGIEESGNKKIKVNDRSPWLKCLLEDAPIPAVCSDSQALIEALDNLLSEKGYKTLRVDSKTVPEDYVKQFLEDCDSYLEEHRPDVLLYTPSAESGVDVSITNFFTHHFGFFFGVIGVDSILQMLGRIRADITKYVWCKSFVSEEERQHSNSPFAQTIEKSINELLINDINTSITDSEAWAEKIKAHLFTVVSNSNTVDFRVSCLIKSIENYEKSNLRECLKEALVESGYTLRDCVLESDSDSGNQAKNEVEAVKHQNARDIFTAEKIAPELVNELKFDARWEERCKVIQAKLRERLPGIENTKAWTEDFIYRVRYEEREFLSQCEMFWLFQHPEIAKQQSQEKLHRMARRLQTFIGKIKSRWAIIHALQAMGFSQFLNPQAEWSDDSPEVISLFKQGKQHSNSLGKHPGKQTNIRYLGNLLSILGLKLKSRKEGNKRFYSIDMSVLNDPIRLQVLQCIEVKMTQEHPQLNWNAAVNEAYRIVPENDAQTQSEQAVQAETRDSQNVYRNEQSRVSENQDIQSQVDSYQIESPVEELAIAFPFCENPEQFLLVIEGYSQEVVESAIVLQDSQPERQRLQQWWEESRLPGAEVAIAAQLPTAVVGESLSAADRDEVDSPAVRSWQWSELPLVKSVLRWIDRPEQVRLLSVEADGMCQVRSLLSGLVTNSRLDQLMPLSG